MTMVSLFRFIAETAWSNPSVAPELDRAWLKTSEPAMINKIITLILAVSISDFQISLKVKSAPSIPVMVTIFLKILKK